MLGLMGSAELEATQSNNARRQVLYSYPTAAAPLTYLMSMMENDEETDKQKFDWFEDRYRAPRSTTATNAAIGPFADTNNIDLTEAGFSLTSGDIIRLMVADATQFRQNDLLKIVNAAGTASSTKQVYLHVLEINTTTNRLTVRVMETVANVLNTTANNGLQVIVTGSAAIEGDRSKEGGSSLPVEPQNYTQIFRSVVGPFTRNALKMGQKFDKTGIYNSTAMKEAQRHMSLLEMSLIMGRRSVRAAVNAENQTTRLYTTGGIIWFLEQWEKRNISNGGAFDYATGESDLTSTNWADDDNKRIIAAGGTLTEDQFEEIIRRLFKSTGDMSYEKLVICDGKFLGYFNKYVKRASLTTRTLNSKEDTYGLHVTAWESAHGIIYFKTHPLFNDHPSFQGSAIGLDFGRMKWRPFQDSDTDLYKNRQNNDTDGRKDEWLTEGGFEIRFPESFCYIHGLTGITP